MVTGHKLAVQLSACQPLDVALMAELFWIVQLICATTQPRQPFKRLGVCTDALEYAHFKRFATETS